MRRKVRQRLGVTAALVVTVMLGHWAWTCYSQRLADDAQVKASVLESTMVHRPLAGAPSAPASAVVDLWGHSATAAGHGAMLRALRAGAHGNPYATILSAAARGKPDDWAVIRQIANYCLAGILATRMQTGVADPLISRVFGERVNSENIGAMDDAKSLLLARCQSILDDASISDIVERARKYGSETRLHGLNEFLNSGDWGGGASPEDWLTILASGFFHKNTKNPEERYIDGVLWGGAQSAEAYERALYQAVINMSYDPSSKEAHIFGLLVCANNGICGAPVNQLASLNVPADATQLRQDIDRLTPIIQSAIEEGRIEAFRPPKAGK